jgi:hypothetical protein
VKKPVALFSLAATLLAAPLGAEKLVREISGSALKAGGQLQGGEVVPPGPGLPFETLRVANPEGVPRTIPLFTIDRPGVKAPRYVLRGEVSGEGIEGQGYLEMWNFFPGGGRYFSRTLAPAGPMASLGGTFRARPFVLPFTAEPGTSPERLSVGVALPGRGAVSLGRLRLMELDSSDDFFTPAGAWLTGRQISLFGGIGGSVLGLLWALVGILVSRGRARGLVLALLQGMLAFGAVALLAALVGWWRGQPRELLSALLLLGSVCTLLSAALLAKVRRQYEEKEFRRMRALDAH